jgi:DNA-binding transcriptional ArsR family regulator
MVNDSPDALDAVFSALADPTRRAILQRLARGAATVGELAEPFDMSLPAVSKHLRVLEAAGLTRRRVEGRVHHIGLAPDSLREAARWLESHRRFWESRLDALESFLAETSDPQETAWPRPKPPLTSRSGSRGRSPRPPQGSSRRGRRPKR